tara:strand:- start:97 stop:546 length:450 start_codon:yes stop_codon:yes gene_type:complete
MHDEYESSEDLAKDELKRIDHLIFVTLKYTRTVDVIKTIIGKFIAALDCKIEDYYNNLFEKEKISRIPPVALVRVRKLEDMYPKDKKVKSFVDFYEQLKQIYNADYRAREEYRKNVTMVTKTKDVNIAILKEYVEYVKEYISYIDGLKL